MANLKSKEDKRADRRADRRAKLLAGIDKFMGSEPDPKSIKTPMDINRAYNWYHYSCDIKQFVSWIVEFMKNSDRYTPQQIATYKSVPDYRTSATAGAIARMVNNGADIPYETIDWAHDSILKTLTYAPVHKNSELVQPRYTVSIADRVKQKTFAIMGDLEEELDKLFHNDYNSDFKPYEYMKKNDIKAIHASKIVSHYEPLRAELQQVLTSKDTQLKEGYSHLTKPQLQRYLKFVSTIISDTESISQVNKATRKTRKPKEKSADQITSKMKYLKESSQYKIASIDPTRIIKAQTLITFNSKYKKLGVYIAADPSGLSVKGTTITNYDPEKSISKTLRKPEDILPTAINIGKLAFNKMFTGIKTTPASLNGRINEDTILVRIL
jgi:hypothetical protein